MADLPRSSIVRMVDLPRSSIVRRVAQRSTNPLYTLSWVTPMSLENRKILPRKPTNNPSLVLTMKMLRMALAMMVANMGVLKMLAMMVAKVEVPEMVLTTVVAGMEVLMVALAEMETMMETLRMVQDVVGAMMEVMMVMLAMVRTTIATTNKILTLAQTLTKYLHGWGTSWRRICTHPIHLQLNAGCPVSLSQSSY